MNTLLLEHSPTRRSRGTERLRLRPRWLAPLPAERGSDGGRDGGLGAAGARGGGEGIGEMKRKSFQRFLEKWHQHVYVKKR